MIRRTRYYIFSYIISVKPFELSGVASSIVTSEIGRISVVDTVEAVRARFEDQVEIVPVYLQEISWRQRQQWDRIHGIMPLQGIGAPRHVSIERVARNNGKNSS